MAKTNRTNKRYCAITERRAYVFGLRRAGASYEMIAQGARQHFGDRLPPSYNKRTAYDDVTTELEALRHQLTEDAPLVRAMELDRLDRLLMGIWQRASQGHEGAIDRVLKIMERRARYLPLEVPQKQALTTPDGEETYDPQAAMATLEAVFARLATEPVDTDSFVGEQNAPEEGSSSTAD